MGNKNTKSKQLTPPPPLTNLDIKSLEIDTLYNYQTLRIQIDSELATALNELIDLENELSKINGEDLLEKCTQSALSAVVGHFGLGALVNEARDGGSVDTIHNVNKGVWVDESKKAAYEAEAANYNSHDYHKHPDYIARNRELSAKQKMDGTPDCLTGEILKSTDKSALDHKYSAAEIHRNPGRILAKLDGPSLANVESNLDKTDASLNSSKGAKPMDEWLENGEKRYAKLKEISQKRPLTDKEKKEFATLEKQSKINKEEATRQYEAEKKRVKSESEKAYYKSSEFWGNTAKAALKEGGKMAAYKACGEILYLFIKHLMDELKYIIKHFNELSFEQMWERLKKRMTSACNELKKEFGKIAENSAWCGFTAALASLAITAINTFYTTLKSIVRLIRAGVTHIIEAVRFILNPPKDMPEEDLLFEATKILINGGIMVAFMIGGEELAKKLKGFGVVLPAGDIIIEASCLCLSAAFGAVICTIVTHYLNKWRNDIKQGKIKIQIMAKSGEIVALSQVKTWMVVGDGYAVLADSITHSMEGINETKRQVEKTAAELDRVDKEADTLLERMQKLQKRRENAQ